MNEDKITGVNAIDSDTLLASGVSRPVYNASKLDESFNKVWGSLKVTASSGKIVGKYQPYSWDVIDMPHSMKTTVISRGEKAANAISPAYEQLKQNYISPFEAEYGDDNDLIPDPVAKQVESAIGDEMAWLDEYQQKIMSSNSRRKKSKARLAKSNFRNIKFRVEDLLKTYDKLLSKEIGDIAITGSLALFLQGKISRNILGDLDVAVRSGEIQLDDEFEDVRNDMGYDPNNSLVASPNMYYYNECLIDIFPVEKQIPESVVVEYDVKSYLCIDYKHIVEIKLKMILPKMKDYESLYGNCFELNFL